MNANSNNTTNIDKEVLQWEFLAFVVFVLITCIVCNALILGVFTLEKTFRNQTNIFVASLASADIVVGMISMPMWIANSTPGVNLSFYINSIDLFCCSASIISCALLSVERALKITCPYWYANTVTTEKVKLVIFLGWFAAFAVGGLSLARKTDEKNIPYISFISIVMYALPVLTVVISYTSIFVVALKHAHKIRNTHQSTLRQESDAKIAWRLGIFILVFIICWTPVFIQIWEPGVPEELEVVSCTLPYINAVINPFLYALATTSFRKGMKRLCTRKNYLQSKMSWNKKVELSTVNTNINNSCATDRNTAELSPAAGRRNTSLLKHDCSNVSCEESLACAPSRSKDRPLLKMEYIWETTM